VYAFSPDHIAVVVIYFKALRGLPYLQMPWFASAPVDDSVDLLPLLHTRSPAFLVGAGDTARFGASQHAQTMSTYRLVVSEVPRQPESLADSIVPDSVYTGESLETIGDEDDFHYDAGIGVPYVFYLRSLDGQPPGAVGASWTDAPAAWPWTKLGTSQPATDLKLNASPVLRDSIPGPHLFIVRCELLVSAGKATDCGHYQFELKRIDTLPEGVDPVLVVNDSVRSALDYSGDIDDYSFTAPAGSTVQLFLRTESTVPDGRTVQAVWSQGGYQVDAFAAAAGEGGIHGVDSHQTVVNGGPYQVRLYGGRDGTRAVYTLFVSVTP